MGRIFHYKEVARLLNQKPHSVRAYASVNKFKADEFPEEVLLELLEKKISKLEKIVKRDPVRKEELKFFKRSYKSVKGIVLESEPEEEIEEEITIKKEPITNTYEKPRVEERKKDISKPEDNLICGLAKEFWGIPKRQKPIITDRGKTKTHITEKGTKIVIYS